ncbi:FtsB family cell division protein [Phycicoccus flavus]|uniref:FtsB family cell division protein n=1 Tax=Phycicoccus flavus TaxID=2502783 RepID=UPI000FEBC33E|nr:septum formation initiator family protein [Phycicoccus flavus]NHA67570.1 septum formation initiator family protein [Phycicoccus flavus]
MPGRTTRPASRPPRRGTGARASASRSTGSGARSAGGRTRSTASAATRSTGTPTTSKVVRRTRSGWPGRIGGAVTHRLVRRGVVLAGIAVFLTVLLASSVAAWVHQRGEIAALQDRVAAQEADVEALRAERERWEDPAYVEQQARERLKFVRPGERSYTVLDPEPETADTPAVAGPGADEAAPVRPWYDTVWESVRTADAPGARR